MGFKSSNRLDAVLVVLLGLGVATLGHGAFAGETDLPRHLTPEFRNLLLKSPNPELASSSPFPSVLRDPRFMPVVRLNIMRMSKSKKVYFADCSGAVIGPKSVLTARHCLDEDTIDQEVFRLRQAIVITDGMTRNPPLDAQTAEEQAELKKLYLSAEVIPHVYRMTGFADAAVSPLTPVWSTSNDAVVISVDREIRQEVGEFKIYQGPVEDLMKTGRRLSFAGFPSGSTWNQGADDAVKYFSKDVCSIGAIENNVIFSNCTPESGLSGGPIFILQNHEYQIVGILSHVLDAGPMQGVRFTGLKWLKSLRSPVKGAP